MKTKILASLFHGKISFTAFTLLSVMAFSATIPLAYAEDIIPTGATQVAVADTTPPSDVENVKATGGNGQVTLNWNVATDDAGVTGYKVYYDTKPVTQDGGKYTKGPVDAGNKIMTTITGLTNGIPYYFAVTAYDAAGNESENYSIEVSATPSAAAADTVAPKVVSAKEVDKNTVKVVFNEAVTLPAVTPESAFAIKNDVTQAALAVTKVEMDVTDKSNKTVTLKTADQTGKTSYVVTVGIQMKDLAGNPIISGTSDTAVFTGSDLKPAADSSAQADTKAPEITSVKPLDASHIEVTFSEAVTLSNDPTQNFIITEEQNIENTLSVTKAELNAQGTVVTLTTDLQKAMNYNLIVVDVADKAGNLISVDNNAVVFPGSGSAAPTPSNPNPADNSDTVSPEDATNLMAKLVQSMVVGLTWKGSADTAGDLAQYVLYTKKDGEEYGDGVILQPNSTSFNVENLQQGMKYFFKLTAKDKSGNESEGVTTSFVLPGTGPELGLLALGSLGAGKFLRKKKKLGKK